MEEKNLVTLPDKVADYLEFMKEKNYTLIGAFKIVIGSGEIKDLMKKFFENYKNQEKFAEAWIHGYKLEEANFGWVFDCEGVKVKEVK
jgi:hypothetical protein